MIDQMIGDKRESFLTEMQQLKERCQRSSATTMDKSPSGTLTYCGISLPCNMTSWPK